MNDDDYIMLDARIDGLREAIAAIVSGLHDSSSVVVALQALQTRMRQGPIHPGTSEEVEQLVALVEQEASLGEAVGGDGQHHGKTTPE